MRYPDTVRLATTTSDMYGDKTVESVDDIPACFVKRAGVTHSQSIDGETSSAAVYLSPANQKVLDVKDSLEGMYLQSEPFTDENWYKIVSVNIAERKLLDNAIDNVYCRLEKVAGMPYVRQS